MKQANPAELIANIQEARQHIKRLKQQAEQIDATLIKKQKQKSQSNLIVTNNNNNNQKFDQAAKFSQFVNNALYSLVKNQNQIQTKVKAYKNSKLLPYIKPTTKQEESLYFQGYKKYKKQFKNANQNNVSVSINKSKVNSFSTKADQSFSLAIQNRKMKIHSHHQKNIPRDINSDSNIPISPDMFMINESFLQKEKEKRSSIQSSSIRSRKIQQARQLKYVNLNQSTLKDIKDMSNKQKSQIQVNSLEYKQVLDVYSNHVFMIIKGRTAIETPQFGSYQRIYQSIFPMIKLKIKELQDIVKEYQINFARFDGKRLAYLCLRDNIKRNQLIQCFLEGRNQIIQKLPQTKYKGKQGRIRAANKIISFWKMITIRSKFKTLKKNTIILQRFFKRKHLMLELQKKIILRNKKIMQNFEKRQTQLQQNWKNLKHQRRVQIHLNSMQLDQEKRLTIQNFNERQNIQLSRIFRLRDQNVILVYVSSQQISSDLINYYEKILQLSNIRNYKDRLIFINPKISDKFPEHFSTSKLVYYCSRTLNQLKIITSELPTVLYSGHPCNQLIKICDFLNCYLFGGQPHKMKQFMTKSQTKRLLKNLCLQTLPGSMQMYDYGEFLNTFSVLILKNPQVSTWILKIDDEFGGRGIAYFETSKSKIISSFLKKVQYSTNSQFFTTDIVSDPGNQQITIKIRDYLKEKLPSKLMISTPSLYRNFEEFMGRFIKKGGIIQASPPCLKENLTYPSISFCIEPDGQHKIVSTYEKIIGQPYKSVACSFPQKSLTFENITTLCRQVTQSFKLRKLFGYFTIDLVSYKKNNESKFWVLDIEPYMNDYSSSFYLFDALMEGGYFPQKNLYLTETFENNKAESMSIQTLPSDKQFTSLVPRQYVFIPHFFNKNFRKVNIKDFFKQARIQNFNFDIAQKYGICMLLFDQLTSGQMGLLVVSQTKEDCVERLKKVLQFIGKISSVKSIGYGKSQLQASTDATYITDIMSVFLSLQRKQKRKDAKKKALQQYKNNQNLQFLS